MSRQIQLVLLYEDNQQRAFMRRFFKKMGWRRPIREEPAPGGAGSAAQFVRERFVTELLDYRRRRGKVENRALALMIDGDSEGVAGRLLSLDAACRDAGLAPRTPDERVAVFAPTWNIETWIAYLRGESVDETRSDYRRLTRRERKCREQVDNLVAMCRERTLRPPAPPSLAAASREYRTRLAVARGDKA